MPDSQNHTIMHQSPWFYLSAQLACSTAAMAVILRVRSLSHELEAVILAFPAGAPKSVRISTVAETPVAPAANISLHPFGSLTLRIEFP